ncbi:2-phospho-L-lactate transferase [Microbacterium sp. ET2]|uniref:2-phospho-L-lactate transferase n=1 Tax=Microbacterium albipurpureum TaxID=3050384 RepID=UPI00259D0584|nr:2-phospho-L-lactate transferase [Microbacterium sp. ET2 (Ac-2212)]WJL96571.1 2-phospho-L-lactate transferase [Microbacterium sp. ET2 (Ac-2212)]
MKITVIAGGVGGARFVRGVREHVRRSGEDHTIDVVVNTGDDWWLAGLRIWPDHDSILYTLAGQNDEERGWGRRGESERVSAELRTWGVTPEWFTLGDLDLGTHIARTAWLRAGETPTEVARRLGARWDLGVTLHPATDDEIDTHIVTPDGERLHFQEWWTRHRARLPVARFEQQAIDEARPAPAALAAVAAADVILIAPSNPVVSIGPMLQIPGFREALSVASAPIVGVSPIIGGAAVRGMAEACLAVIGVDADAGAVARHYGTRVTGGVLDGWLVGEEDSRTVPSLDAAGIVTRAVPLWMRDADTSAALAADAVALARTVADLG